MKYYTGVGSRNTPMYILYMMSKLAMIFEKKGFILRSGCALGADAAFEDVLMNPAKNAEIYIPANNFPGKMGTSLKSHYICPEQRFGTKFNDLFCQATRLIHKDDVHKGWKYLDAYTMKLHNRNMFQVLGIDLKTKSNFNICYTKAGELKYEETNRSTGGTGTAINASDLYNVEIFNLGNDEHYKRLSLFIEKNKHLIDYERLNATTPRTELNKKSKYDSKFISDYSGYLSLIESEKLKRDIKVGLTVEETIVTEPSKKKKNNRRLKP